MKNKNKYLPSTLFLHQNKVLLQSLLMFLLCSFQSDWLLHTHLSVQGKNFQTDRMGNMYVLTQTNQLSKYDETGRLLSTLNYGYQGNMSFLDAGNPMELYLFYKELNSIVFLDNNLAYRGKLNLTDLGIMQASAIGRSYSNGIWVFDLGEFQLKKLSKEGSVLQSSGNIRQFAHGKNLSPNLIIDNGNKVFLCDSTEGIMVFDIFANYLKTIPIKGKQTIKILNDCAYYIESGQLISYQFGTLKKDTIKLPENMVRDFSLEKEHLYLMNDTAVNVYRFKE